MSTNVYIMISIVAYMLLVLGIGVWFSSRNKTTDDFYLGGRKLGPFVTAMSAEASDMSSYLLMGVPGVAFLTGIADASWTAIGLAIGTYLNWLFVAKRLRRYSSHIGANTVPAFFSERFKDKSRALSIIAAVVIIIFFVPYTASGFVACGKLFNSLFGVDYMMAMVICAGIIILYTMLGGFLAASTSDFIQSIVMTIALVIVLGYGVIHAGGMDAVIENAKEVPGYFHMTQTYTPAEFQMPENHTGLSGLFNISKSVINYCAGHEWVLKGSSGGYGFITICSTLAWGLGYFGMPHILLRFMAIEDTKKLTLSRRVASVWVVISLGVAVMIGIIGRAMLTRINGINMLNGDSERILIVIAQHLSRNGAFAAITAGVIFAGILAATMSTADSQLLAASSSVSQNIVKEKLFPKMEEKTTMLIARLTLVIIAIVAVILASNRNSSVFEIVSFAWAGFGAAFGPVMLFSLFWKRTTKWGALAGMVSGGAVIFIWKFLIRPLGDVVNIYELLPAFIVACIAILVVSLMTKAPSQEITSEFEAVKAMKD